MLSLQLALAECARKPFDSISLRLRDVVTAEVRPGPRALESIAPSGLASLIRQKLAPVRFAQSLFLCFLFLFKMVISHASRATLAARLL
jgi:hypothetical protein